MKSIDFKADRHKLNAHRAVHKPPPAEQPPTKHRKPDLLDRLIDQHPLLHHIELLIPSTTLSTPLLPLQQSFSYHVSARLTSFLSSSFLLPLLASGSLAAFSLATPIDRCNTFTLLSSAASTNVPPTSATAATTATLTLTVDDDTYQQLGLAGQPLPALPGFHVITVPIQPFTWHPSSRHYQRVHTCLAAMAEVELLVQHTSHSGQDEGAGLFTATEGIRLIKRVDNAEQRWQTDERVALPDVSAVWLAGCDDSDRHGMLRQQRKDAEQQVDQLDVELVDWIGLATHRLVDLLPTHATHPHLSTSPPSLSLVDHAFCTSLPLLPATASTSLAAVRYTGVLSHGHVWRTLLSYGRSLLSSEAAAVPWVCLMASSMVDAGNVVGVDGSGNAENDWCVLLLRDGRYLLYHVANACLPVH